MKRSNKKLLAIIVGLALVIQYSIGAGLFTSYAEEIQGDTASNKTEAAAPEAKEKDPEPEPEPAPAPKEKEPESPQVQKEAEPEPVEAQSAEQTVKLATADADSGQDGSGDAEAPEGEAGEAGDGEDVEDPDAVQSEEPTEGSEEIIPGEGEEIGEEVDDPDSDEDEDKDDDEYPEVTLTKTVGGVTVTLHAPKGALPKGAKLEVSTVTAEKYFSAVAEQLESEGKELTDAIAFDVTPLNKDGEPVQPHKSVTVTFSGTGLDLEAGGDVDVFHVSDDAASVDAMGTSIAGADKQQFSTNHFSIYVVGSNSTADPQGTGASFNNRYILEFGEYVELASEEKGSYSDNWTVSTGSQYITFSTTNMRAVNDKNISDSSHNVTIRHSYKNAWYDPTHNQDFYITVLPPKYTVNFNLMDAGRDEFTVHSSTQVYRGEGVTPPTDLDPEKEVEGKTYRLYSWYTDQACTQPANNQTFRQIRGDLEVYAKYSPLVTIHYNKNTTAGTTSFPADQSAGAGTNVTLGTASRSGYVLESWNTQADGEGESYSPGQRIQMFEENTTLYARWDESFIDITYNLNGGTWDTEGEPPLNPQTAGQNSRATLHSEAVKRDESIFLGWATSRQNANNGNVAYYPGQTIPTGTSPITLYAAWGEQTDDKLIYDTLTANGKTVTYNGTRQSISGVTEQTGGQVERGRYLYVGTARIFGFINLNFVSVYADIQPITAQGIDAGNYPTPVAAELYWTIIGVFYNPQPFDNQYLEVTNNVLTIEPAELEINTDSYEAEFSEDIARDGLTAGGQAKFTKGGDSDVRDISYNGSRIPLIQGDDNHKDYLNIKTTGCQKTPGTCDNEYEVDWGTPDGWGGPASTAQPYNYIINDGTIGTLKVFETAVLNYDPNEGSGDTMDPTTGEKGTTVKTATNTYEREHYSFKEWNTAADGSGDSYAEGADFELSNAENTLYAIWEPIMFDVTFVDEDGETVLLEAKSYQEGTSSEDIEQPAEEPTKPADAQYTYTFAGWDPELAEVTKDVTYTATYDATVNKYTVTFEDEDGSVISEAEYEYGTAAADIEKPADPKKAADGENTYEFAGWDPELAEVTENATYTATYTATPIPDDPDDPDDPDNPDEPDDDDDDTPAAAAAAAPPAPPADGAEDIEDEPTPQAAPETIIPDEETPLAGTWSVANLALAVITAVGAALALFRKREDADEYEDEDADRKMLIAKIAGALAGVAAPVTFFVTENLGGVAAAFDKWSPVMVGILGVQVVAAILNNSASKGSEFEEEAEDAAE